jgi:hypothetical protein
VNAAFLRRCPSATSWSELELRCCRTFAVPAKEATSEAAEWDSVGSLGNEPTLE